MPLVAIVAEEVITMREYIVVIKVDEEKVLEAQGFRGTTGINLAFTVAKEFEHLEDSGITLKYLKDAK